jgi:hypothetical protein
MNQYTLRLAAFVFLSWTGSFVHHRIELPQLSLLSPEHLIPTLISIGLFVLWWRTPFKRAAAIALLVWAVIPQFLLGGILSVFPLEFWPFFPPQTLQHYLVHAGYALAQVPLILLLNGQLFADQHVAGAGERGA